ncbi:unnamed protein product [Schistocephalus solidus]|uniref:Amiloride-sensitive sodium channel n=1 Tax=Schistocephalus solidus TaxID=70667 RepID=A0A183THX6_SCHSO|nr:unnamed protein product [Schistocephalus solidus]
MPELRNNFDLFCELTSIRGLQRIKKAPTFFGRVIWSAFVIAMTLSLFITIGFLARDFLSYNTAWHARTIIGDKANFPAITVCAHNPFSLEANTIWKKNEILTPTGFNKRLSEITLEFIKHDKLEYASVMLLDSTENYYANLRPNESQTLSHQTDMFPHCMVTADGVRILAENCAVEADTGFTKRYFSHPRYFNCWTLETAANHSTRETVRLTLLIRLVPSVEIDEAKNNFIMDTFSRGEGVKLVVHESGTYPEIDKDGINVQPGRMNELSFQTIKWVRLQTPIAPCLEDPKPIFDMGSTYTYRLTQCLDSILQNISINSCGCLNSEWPRTVDSALVNTKIPYCSALPKDPKNPDSLKDMVERLTCAGDLLHRVKELKEEAIRQRNCISACSYYTYPVSASITSWKPMPEKLNYFTEKCQRVESLQNNPQQKEKFIRYLERTLNSSSADINSSTITSLSSKFAKNFENEGLYTYISLVRTSYDTTLQEERLIFDFYILISRVGGLCSIFVGLTAAFLVELIEFIYLVCRQYKKQDSNVKKKDMELGQTENNEINLQGMTKQNTLATESVNSKYECPEKEKLNNEG